MLVSAIVLSYNRKEETLKCLRSLVEYKDVPIEIVVVDNGSMDGSADAIEKDFPDVRLIRMPTNYGDWQGRNIALSNCKGRHILCIDNDAYICSGVVRNMLLAFNRDPDIAVVEARVEDPDTGAVFLCERELAGDNFYRANFLGGAAMYEAKALREVGGFPHYLLGGAETHLSLRFLDRGRRIYRLGESVIYHKMSSKERQPRNRYFLQTKQRTRALLSHLPGFVRPAIELAWKPVGYVIAVGRIGKWYWAISDAPQIFLSGLRAWLSGSWRVRPNTVHLFDYLQSNIVYDKSDYDNIPHLKSNLVSRIVRRFYR